MRFLSREKSVLAQVELGASTVDRRAAGPWQTIPGRRPASWKLRSIAPGDLSSKILHRHVTAWDEHVWAAFAT
jgi:hypothetical protein